MPFSLKVGFDEYSSPLPTRNDVYLPFNLPSPVPASSSRFLGRIHDWNKIRMHFRQRGTKEAAFAVIWTEERATETESINKACQAYRTAWAEAPVSLGRSVERLLLPLLLSMGCCANPVSSQLSKTKRGDGFPNYLARLFKERLCLLALAASAVEAGAPQQGSKISPHRGNEGRWIGSLLSALLFYFIFFPNLHPKGTDK